MALKSGLNAQLGFASETNWGSAVTVTKFVPLVSESIDAQIARNESAGIIPGRRVLSTNQFASGDVTVSGDINLELSQQGIGTLWKWALGAVSTTGSGPYTHTFTPGDLSDDHLTMQVGKPDTGGTTDAFTFSGVKCASWEVAAKASELVTASFSVLAKSLATNTALASASYTNGVDKSFSYVNGTVSVGGSSVNVKEFTVSGDNGLTDDRRFVGSPTIAEPLEAALREYTGELLMEWESLTQFNRFAAGSTHAFSAAFSAGADASFTISGNVRLDGSTPMVEGPGVLEQKVPVKFTAGTDAGALTITIVNNDATN